MKTTALRLILPAGLMLGALPALATEHPCPIRVDSHEHFPHRYHVPLGSHSNSPERLATQFLKTVPSGATLARLKQLLPKETRFSPVEDTQLGAWTWHVVHFNGPLAGGLVFANNRRAAGQKQGLNEDKPTDKKRLERMAMLRSGDPVHYVEVFLGNEVEGETPAVIRQTTKSHMDAISRYLGTPAKKEYTGNGDGVASYGWLAEWHLSHHRVIWFYTTMALLSSGNRPLLTLEFPYAHVYRE